MKKNVINQWEKKDLEYSKSNDSNTLRVRVSLRPPSKLLNEKSLC